MSDIQYYCPNCMKTRMDVYRWNFHDNHTQTETCYQCGGKLIKTNFIRGELPPLIEASSDPSFIDAMMKLKDKDIIEFNLKMSQFRAQMNEKDAKEVAIRQENEKKQEQESIRIKCPRCGSTAVTTGPRGANGFWGFIGAGKTVNRCGNCGNTWKPRG